MCLVDVLIDTVQAKLRSLHEFHQRLLHNTVPLPSGVDIANTIKYFSQTLLSEYRRCDGLCNFIDSRLSIRHSKRLQRISVGSDKRSGYGHATNVFVPKPRISESLQCYLHARKICDKSYKSLLNLTLLFLFRSTSHQTFNMEFKVSFLFKNLKVLN